MLTRFNLNVEQLIGMWQLYGCMYMYTGHVYAAIACHVNKTCDNGNNCLISAQQLLTWGLLMHSNFIQVSCALSAFANALLARCHRWMSSRHNALPSCAKIDSSVAIWQTGLILRCHTALRLHVEVHYV